MKTKQNLCIICMMLLISSCKDCKQCNYTQYETAPVILEYFGNYKPGNYWIYENQDGTKKDSMWVSDYVESKGGDEYSCCQYPKIQFVLNSQYWGKSNSLKAIIDNGQCKNSAFTCYDTLDYVIFDLRDETIKNLPKNELDMLLMPNVGIKTFYSINGTDSFKLIKYQIK